MADNEVAKYGEITYGPHVTMARTASRSDNTTLEVEAVGEYTDLENIVVYNGPGTDAASALGNTMGDLVAGYRVRTLSVARAEGGIGVLRASLVKCSSLTSAYHVTYSVEMQEVQRKLMSHPWLVADTEAMKEIVAWMGTDERFRFVDGKYKYADPNSTTSLVMKEVVNERALKYCAAFMAGIESYNIYLPVVSKVSLFLKEPPGTSQDETTHELSGQMRYSTNIGHFDGNGMDFTIQGYPAAGWFKSKDSYVQNADGTWQRNEEWTYTFDLTHNWIYDNLDFPTPQNNG